MSTWTHVCGCIRYDDLRPIRRRDEELKRVMGRPSSCDDVHNADPHVPCGSEGSIQLSWHENPNEASLASYDVSIWGDLRDYDDLSEIEEWFGHCVNGLPVRNAVLYASVEGGDSMVLTLVDSKVIKTMFPQVCEGRR